MPEGDLDQKWFADKFIKISETMGQIVKGQEDVEKKIDNMCDELTDHERRLDVLETANVVQKEKSKWEKARPFVVGGSIGGGTILGTGGIVWLILEFILGVI